MNEVEWLACADPTPMHTYLQDKASHRKLCLFGVACCRRIWHRIFIPSCRHAVEVAEWFIDGKVEFDELEDARTAAEGALQATETERFPSGEYSAIALALAPHWKPDRWPCVYSVASQATSAAARFSQMVGRNKKERKRNYLRGHQLEETAQSALLRDIFGNPFRPTSLVPSWLSWNDRTIPKMAQAIYEDRAFDRLPILADALEDAGCDDQEILDHCRSNGEHVRGCWVVDLLLGKS